MGEKILIMVAQIVFLMKMPRYAQVIIHYVLRLMHFHRLGVNVKGKLIGLVSLNNALFTSEFSTHGKNLAIISN
ncbi:hypothetical protein C3364_10200 [Avibacterium paragallinarum]|nr:hypothetical protein C3364_10200 [Avibacterium paragallinarum]